LLGSCYLALFAGRTEGEKLSPENRIVIIGAGQAGGRAAAALRSSGFAGTIQLVGAESYPPYERPPLSKEILANISGIEKTYLRPPSFYNDIGVELLTSRTVKSIDRGAQCVTLDSEDQLPYDQLLLTMGARARRLPLSAAVPHRTHYLRDIEDARRLRARLATGVRLLVIGAGFVGLEVAATARKLGCKVTVVEAQSHPLARVLPPDIASVFTAYHASNDVQILTNTTIKSLDCDQEKLIATTADGRSVEADEVVIGIGVIPNDELAQQSGLAVNDGVLTDEFSQTSDPRIFAAGDVTRHFNPLLGRSIRLEAWDNAQNQAPSAARNMVGQKEAYAVVPWFWTHQYDLNFQLAGLPENWNNLVWRGEPGEKGSIAFALDSESAVVGGASISNVRDMRFVKKLIATSAQIGPRELANTQIPLASFLNRKSVDA